VSTCSLSAARWTSTRHWRGTWPEFGACGKNAITVSKVIAHRAGLITFDPPLSTADLLDWDTAVEALAAMRPLWEPGSAYAYHSLTFGFIAGELVPRASGRPVGRFLADVHAVRLELHGRCERPLASMDRGLRVRAPLTPRRACDDSDPFHKR